MALENVIEVTRPILFPGCYECCSAPLFDRIAALSNGGGFYFDPTGRAPHRDGGLCGSTAGGTGQVLMSAFGGKADINGRHSDVCF